MPSLSEPKIKQKRTEEESNTTSPAKFHLSMLSCTHPRMPAAGVFHLKETSLQITSFPAMPIRFADLPRSYLRQRSTGLG